MELSVDAWRRITMAFGFVALALFGWLLISDCGTGAHPAEQASHFERLLALMPDTPDTRSGVTMVDYARFRSIVKLDVPAGPLDDAAQGQYALELQAHLDFNDPRFDPGLLAIRDAGTMWAGLDEYGRIAIGPQTTGYGPANIDGEIYAGPEGRRYVALDGRFDPAASQRALSVPCKRCPEIELKTYKGARYFSWGSDFQTDLRMRLKPGHDQRGRAGRMLFAPDKMMRTEWNAGIEQMIDAPLSHKSLADNASFADVAKRLDAMQAFLGYITIDIPASKGASSQPQALRRYNLMGLGQGSAGGTPYLVVILVHDSVEAADANVALLQNRIATLYSESNGKPWAQVVKSTEIWHEGPVLLARLYGSRDFKRLIEEGDSLLLHE
jgi:hypothetical protein